MKTQRTRGLPRFFTQGIGSLPRPQLVLAEGARLLRERAKSQPD